MSPADVILRKALVASGLDTRQWNAVQASLRNRAFFSAEVESARILDAMRRSVRDLVDSQKSPSEIRRDLRAYLGETGYTPGERAGTIKDLYTKARLDVMMRTNAEQARGFASHLKAISPGAISAAPAYELVRVKVRKAPRDWRSRWQKAANAVGWEGVARGVDRMVALKSSPVWKEISVFGNPFPPFDYNSGMGLRNVRKSECRALGLLGEHEEPKPPPAPDFNGRLSASVPMRDDSPEARRLKDAFGDQVRFDGNTVSWRGELIRDVVDGKVDRAKLGKRDGRPLSVSHSIVEQHVAKHVGGNETHGGNAPLEKEDFELLPTLWREGRESDARHGRKAYELDTFDGHVLRMVVDPAGGIRTIFKMKGPPGAWQSRSAP